MFGQKNNARGFTLIELLVVITIIGILATGWVAVFTTQLQKARDSTRQKDLKQYQTAVEQYISDNGVYPAAAGFTGSVAKYVSVITEDPKSGLTICTSSGYTIPIGGSSGGWSGTIATKVSCDYAYWRADNSDGIANVAFKLAGTLESDGNVKNFAADKADGGNSNGLFEIFAGGSGGLINLNSATAPSNGLTIKR